MSKWKKASNVLTRHLKSSTKHLDKNDVSDLCNYLLDVKGRNGTLYLIAVERSLEILTIFAARLMQPPICISVRPLASTPKPRIEGEDGALICTGTGETDPVISMSENWLRINNNVALITSSAAKKYNSRILEAVRNPAALICIDGITKRDIKRRREHPSRFHDILTVIFSGGVLAPSQTKFELATLLFLESVITELYYICERKS